MQTGLPNSRVSDAVLARIQTDLERLNILAKLLHDQGLIPTDTYLLAELRSRRAHVEREIRVHLDHPPGHVPKTLTDELSLIDQQIRKLEQ